MEGANAMLQLVTDGIGTVISWIAQVINAVIGSNGELAALAPLFAIGISISAILLGVKLVKSLVWGA